MVITAIIAAAAAAAAANVFLANVNVEVNEQYWPPSLGSLLFYSLPS